MSPPERSRWLTGADSIAATEEQTHEVLDLGERCMAIGSLAPPLWQGLVGSACKGPQTVSLLRDLLSTLFLYYTARKFPELGAELVAKSEQLADLLRVSS
jgi:hypothetical protein